MGEGRGGLKCTTRSREQQYIECPEMSLLLLASLADFQSYLGKSNMPQYASVCLGVEELEGGARIGSAMPSHVSCH